MDFSPKDEAQSDRAKRGQKLFTKSDDNQKVRYSSQCYR
jgi:hypothetical protein